VDEHLSPDALAEAERYGLARCVYAAAHGDYPQHVDDTDGGLQEVERLINDDRAAWTRALAGLVGLGVEADDGGIADEVARLRLVEQAATALLNAVPQRLKLHLAIHNPEVMNTLFALDVAVERLATAVRKETP
jgi:hypothetical protein